MSVEIKICGLTRAPDADAAVEAGADYLGVIFAGGPRERSPEEARLTLARRDVARAVGVFGTQSASDIGRIAERVGLDIIQLHACEQASRVDEVRHTTGLEVWASVRTADGRLPRFAEEVADAADALLIDALAPNGLGGSGLTIPWMQLGESLDELTNAYRIVLAGGLRPENVAEAIEYVSPMIVDVASGVESAPGVKDHALIRAFVAAARSEE